MMTTALRMKAQHAVAEALRFRAANEITPKQPIRVIDVALKAGIDVWYKPLPSMEGIFIDSPPTIFLSSLRQPGRKNFSCGHELAHWRFGDLVAIDELENHRKIRAVRGSNEWAAQVFAGSLLMPRHAVEEAFRLRGWSYQDCGEVQVFALANVFGVGYTTMVDHLAFSLSLISTNHAESLKRVSLSAIKAEILKLKTTENLVVVDQYWPEVSIDLEMGDLLLVKGTSFSVEPDFPKVISLLPQTGIQGDLFQAQTPGIQKVTLASGVESNVRVSRKSFAGRAIWRYEPEVDDET